MFIELLKSRKFWSLAIGLIFIAITAFFPGVAGAEDHVVEIAVIVGSYILGTAVDPKMDWQNKLLEIFKSRKFLAGAAALAVVILKQYLPDFPFTEEQVTIAVITLAGYIFGTGVQDYVRTEHRARDNISGDPKGLTVSGSANPNKEAVDRMVNTLKKG